MSQREEAACKLTDNFSVRTCEGKSKRSEEERKPLELTTANKCEETLMVQARKGANQNRENENGVAENQMKKDEKLKKRNRK